MQIKIKWPLDGSQHVLKTKKHFFFHLNSPPKVVHTIYDLFFLLYMLLAFFMIFKQIYRGVGEKSRFWLILLDYKHLESFGMEVEVSLLIKIIDRTRLSSIDPTL